MIWLILLKDHCINSALDSGPIESTCSSFSWKTSLNLTFGWLTLRFSLINIWPQALCYPRRGRQAFSMRTHSPFIHRNALFLISMVCVLKSRVPWLQSKLLFQQNCSFSFPSKPALWQLASFRTVIDFLSGVHTRHLSLGLSLQPVVGFPGFRRPLGNLMQSFSRRDAHIRGVSEGPRCAQAHPRLTNHKGEGSVSY